MGFCFGMVVSHPWTFLFQKNTAPTRLPDGAEAPEGGPQGYGRRSILERFVRLSELSEDLPPPKMNEYPLNKGALKIYSKLPNIIFQGGTLSFQESKLTSRYSKHCMIAMFFLLFWWEIPTQNARTFHDFSSLSLC